MVCSPPAKGFFAWGYSGEFDLVFVNLPINPPATLILFFPSPVCNITFMTYITITLQLQLAVNITEHK